MNSFYATAGSEIARATRNATQRRAVFIATAMITLPFASVVRAVQNGTTMSAFIQVIFVVTVCLTVAGIAYCLLCTWAGVKFARARLQSAPAIANLPPMSILKPLKGADPEMYEALRSYCMQDYPAYEILAGISYPDDPAAEIVRKLIAEFPQQTIRLVLCEKRLGMNGKVSTLAQLVPQAEHEFLLVSDSDIRVESGYLRTVASELSQLGVGMVTCLYRGVPAGTLASKIEALGIGTDFAAGVLVARTVERGIRFGLGSTMAFRCSDLGKIGGFEALVDFLADDYELGKRVSELGLRVELSRAVVETHLLAYNWRAFLSHQLRWARTIRASRPAGYAGLAFTFTLPWVLAAFLLHPGLLTQYLFIAAVVARYATAVICAGNVLKDQLSLRNLWLLPLRDFLAIAVWIGGLFGRKITWRGEQFKLKSGKLTAA